MDTVCVINKYTHISIHKFTVQRMSTLTGGREVNLHFKVEGEVLIKNFKQEIWPDLYF